MATHKSELITLSDRNEAAGLDEGRASNEMTTGRSSTTSTDLTVVVPTLNSVATVDNTLASLKASSRIRVIVADSESTDGTLDVCRQRDVEVIQVPPGNMYAAINAGLKLAKTSWLTYVNSDDWIFTTSYLKMVDFAAASQSHVTYGSADYVDYSGRFLFSSLEPSVGLASKLLRSGILPFCQPAAVFSADAFRALNGFDEMYRCSADFDFFCRAAIKGLTFTRFQSRPVAAFRLHAKQFSASSMGIELHLRDRHRQREQLHLTAGLARHTILLSWRMMCLPLYVERCLRHFNLSGDWCAPKSNAAREWD
jgi:glycosyltransferase involved in cell wall biosynthesis